MLTGHLLYASQPSECLLGKLIESSNNLSEVFSSIQILQRRKLIHRELSHLLKATQLVNVELGEYPGRKS